jgi:hypothetical protein
MTGQDGQVAYEETAYLPFSGVGLACETPHLEPESPFVPGEYTLGITPLSQGSPLGTFTTTQPIHTLETRRGVLFPAMGTYSPATYDAPMELLGYNLAGGEGFVWTDLFLRSTDKHQGSYFLSVQLVDPDTGMRVSHSDDIIPDHSWKKGDLYGEQRILWLDDVAPGRYSLRIVLQGPPAPGWNTEPSPGDVVVQDVPLLVLPLSARDQGVVEAGTIIAYTLVP